jgi:hypothetical protein
VSHSRDRGARSGNCLCRCRRRCHTRSEAPRSPWGRTARPMSPAGLARAIDAVHPHGRGRPAAATPARSGWLALVRPVDLIRLPRSSSTWLQRPSPITAARSFERPGSRRSGRGPLALRGHAHALDIAPASARSVVRGDSGAEAPRSSYPTAAPNGRVRGFARPAWWVAVACLWWDASRRSRLLSS